MKDPVTDRERLSAAVALTRAVAEVVREAGEIPSGELYAVLMTKIDFAAYESLLRILKRADLVSESASHLLKWVGPAITEEAHRV